MHEVGLLLAWILELQNSGTLFSTSIRAVRPVLKTGEELHPALLPFILILGFPFCVKKIASGLPFQTCVGIKSEVIERTILSRCALFRLRI